ncbi:polysaccharide deacetylase family protein [Naasia sp. SYSU D00057]|uniref:polysaccharide deacetylase family protein n=1 Tax=Naasia sp. SYSU D00057 TaxID=2817380 RepID=UPI001B313916|nr:polysaccharide deacetylase family protein [Naasia sp. SYSU D00057]
MRRTRLVAALAVSGLLLAACATLHTTPGWTPRPAAEPDLVLAVDAADPPPPAVADGLDTRLLYTADPGAGVGARWAEIPGNPRFNEELRARVKDAIDAQAAATGVRFRPAADAPGGSRGCAPGAASRPAAEIAADPALTPQTGGPTVTIVCEIAAASGTVLAESLRIVAAVAGEVLTDTTRLYYADTAGEFLTTADTLLTDDGLRTLLARVVQSLKVGAGALEPQMKEDPASFPIEQLRAWFADFSFGADGSLTVRLPEGFSTAELERLADVPPTSTVAVTVPAADASALLSADGKRVQSALASGAPLTLPTAPARGQEDVDCAFFACIALTYDDGPGPYTADVLDTLASRRSAATFFLQGVYVSRYRSLLLRMRDEGHQLANHTWNHPDLRKLPAPEIADQIARTNALIRSITGTTPSMFRPPYGAYDDTVLAAAGLPAILWSRDTNDWQRPGDAALYERAVTLAKPGDIVLMHDVHQSTARMAAPIIDGLLDRGFTLVTVEQILGGTPAAGTATKR